MGLLFPSPSRASDPDPAESGPVADALGEGVIEQKTIDRFYDPVEIRAEILGDLLGTKLDQLRLYNFSNGALQQVRYQFDEWTPEGSMVLNRGGEANADLGNGILDLQDMLVFMARDAGDRVSGDLRPDGAMRGVEIEIIDPLTNGRGWYYLFQFPESAPEVPFRVVATVDDTDMLIAKGRSFTIVGTNHEKKGKVYKTIVNQNVWVNPEAGGDGRDFVDRSKFRVKARLLFGVIKIGFDEDDFIGEVTKYKIGPVRSVGRQWFGVNMPLGLKSPKIYGDTYVHDTMTIMAWETDIPFNPGHVLTDFTMIVGYDLHDPNGYGMIWYNSNNPEGFLVDGVSSPMEEAYDDRHDKWRCTVGPNGWMLHRSVWDEAYSSQADIKVHYRDDIQHQDPPDYYPGDLGYYYLQSTVKSLKPRKYHYQLEWYFPYDFYSPEGLRTDVIEQILNIRDHPLRVKVGDREVVSTGLQLSLLEP